MQAQLRKRTKNFRHPPISGRIPPTQPTAQTVQRYGGAVLALATLQDSLRKLSQAGGIVKVQINSDGSVTFEISLPGHFVGLDLANNFTLDSRSVMAPRTESGDPLPVMASGHGKDDGHGKE
jgi:hypothetical protein